MPQPGEGDTRAVGFGDAGTHLWQGDAAAGGQRGGRLLCNAWLGAGWGIQGHRHWVQRQLERRKTPG